MAVSLTTLLPHSRSGRTFFAASAFLGLSALIQLSLLGWYVTNVRKGVPIARSGDFAPPSAPTLELPFRVGSSMPPPAVALQPLDAPAIDRPKPAPSARTPLADLIDQARVFRQNGDANNALAKLREAQAMEPDNPQVMAELGITYEIMQLQDRAFEQWQHLYNLGDSVGALYYLADAKLHASSPAVAPAPGAGALTNPGDQTADAPVRDAGGFHDSTMLKITGIHADDDADPAAGKKVSLKIVVKARPGIVIDPKKVNILTYFYDLLDGKDVVQTNAQTGFAWLTPPVDWANDESEVLETTYFRPKDAEPEATPAPATPEPEDTPKEGRHRRGKTHPADTPAPPAPVPPPSVRTYYGYTVRLYYDRQLQDVQADPLRLLQQFPPPLTLSDN